MTAVFSDLRVVGLDVGRTARSDPAGPLFDVHFTLCAPPPAEWALLATTHLAAGGPAGRRAWVAGENVVVRCRVEEVERALADLRPVVIAANREYRDRLAARGVDARAAAATDRDAHEQLRALAGRLTFE